MEEEMVKFQVVQKQIEDGFKEMIKNCCHDDIFMELNMIEAMIVSMSNISIEYWKKRQKISKDALLRLWDISPDPQIEKMGKVLKELNLYEEDGIAID